MGWFFRTKAKWIVTHELHGTISLDDLDEECIYIVERNEQTGEERAYAELFNTERVPVSVRIIKHRIDEKTRAESRC